MPPGAQAASAALRGGTDRRRLPGASISTARSAGCRDRSKPTRPGSGSPDPCRKRRATSDPSCGCRSPADIFFPAWPCSLILVFGRQAVDARVGDAGAAATKLAAETANGLLEVLAAQAEGDVAARLLDDAARQVGLAAQAVGDGIRIIHGDQHRVDLIHDAEQALGLL